MKITTGGTGVISSQSSMMASVLQQAIAALNYNYTWAIDLSHPDITPSTFFNMGAFDTFEEVSSGLRVALDYTGGTGDGPKITFRESDLISSTHSNGSSGNDIPDEAAPDTGASNGLNRNGEGHPGRYFSLVLTIDKFDIIAFPSGTPTAVELAMYHSYDGGGGLNYWAANIGGDPWYHTGVKYVDGVAGSITTQADYNAILGQVKVLTWDHVNTFTLTNPDDNPDTINIYGSYRCQTNFDITFHGFIFSDVPPNAITLPVEITNPTIGSGPA